MRVNQHKICQAMYKSGMQMAKSGVERLRIAQALLDENDKNCKYYFETGCSGACNKTYIEIDINEIPEKTRTKAMFIYMKMLGEKKC